MSHLKRRQAQPLTLRARHLSLLPLTFRVCVRLVCARKGQSQVYTTRQLIAQVLTLTNATDCGYDQDH